MQHAFSTCKPGLWKGLRRSALAALALTVGALGLAAGAARRHAQGRQGRAGGVLLRAARRRHPEGHLQEKRSRRAVDRVPRRRQAAAGDGGRRHRSRARLRPRHGLHRQGLAGQGDRRHGGAAAAARHYRASGRSEDRRRPQGQEDQRLDQGLADLLVDARNLPPPGLGHERHRCRSARCHQGPDRRHGARRYRRHGHRHRHRARAAAAAQGAHPGAASTTSRTS